MTRSAERATSSRRLRAADAVDGDALAARDVAGDRVGRRRPAAARQRRQQRADADDEDAATARRRARRPERDVVGIALRRRRRAQQRLDALQRELVLADDLEQRVGAAKAEPRRELGVLERRPPFALQELLDRLAAARDGRRLRLRVEPRAHLRLRARALQVAELGIEPVERRPADLGGAHLDHLAASQRACSAARSRRRPWRRGSDGRDRCGPRRRSRSASPRRRARPPRPAA